jgi:hypothetical protein
VVEEGGVVEFGSKVSKAAGGRSWLPPPPPLGVAAKDFFAPKKKAVPRAAKNAETMMRIPVELFATYFTVFQLQEAWPLCT